MQADWCIKILCKKRTHSRATAFRLSLPLVVRILRWVGQMTPCTECILPAIQTFWSVSISSQLHLQKAKNAASKLLQSFNATEDPLIQGTSLPAPCLSEYHKHTQTHNRGKQTRQIDTYLQHTWVFVVNFWLSLNIFSLPIITSMHCVLLFCLLSQVYVPQNINSKKIQTNKNALGVGFLDRGKTS